MRQAARVAAAAIGLAAWVGAAACSKETPPTGTAAPASPTAPDLLPVMSDVVLSGAGDIGECGSPGVEATAALLDGIPGAVFTAGDNAYMHGSLRDFQQCFERTWGRHRERMFPAPGNHEVRDLDMAKIAMLQSAIELDARRIAARNGTSVSFEKYYESRGAPADDRLREVIRSSAEALGFSTLSLPSGAGHDAQSLALIAPMGMIFVPSVDGISHSPKELTLPEDIEAGANVLLRSVLATDALALAGR